MLQIAAGHSERLALLYDRHQRRLFNFFLKLGHGCTASEDLVQDTFLRMLRHAHSYRSDGCFLPWIYQIARNTAADAWHEVAVLEALAEDEEALLPAIDEHEPASVHEQQELERRLQRALLRLPRESRELVLLSRVKELDIDGKITRVLNELCCISAVIKRIKNFSV